MLSIKTQLIPLLAGIVLGIHICLVTLYPNDFNKLKNKIKRISFVNQKFSDDAIIPLENPWNSTIADKLFDEIKVLCWIMMGADDHKKAWHIKNTWGKRCNKLLLMSSKQDADLDTIALPVNEGRTNLWDKTKAAFQYIHRKHIEEFDWFLKADDDAYVIMENLRYMLYQYRPQTALYIGHRLSISTEPYTYMSGSTYILSKKALKKLNNFITNETKCRQDEDGNEDLEMGRCLLEDAIFVDDRDSLKQKRFFPVGPNEHLQFNKSPEYWYWDSMYYEGWTGKNCCSEYPIAFHYVNPQGMYFFEYFTYYVKAFGDRSKNVANFPRKLTLEEILKTADMNSTSVNFVHPTITHNIEESEKYFEQDCQS